MSSLDIASGHRGMARNTRPLPEERLEYLRERARFIRLETIRLISIAKVGHYTSVFSCAEIFAALYYDVMQVRKGEPGWKDRDRFLMGKGHAAVGLFPILADLGFFDPAWLETYTRLGSPLGDHPDMTKVPGVDFSSGSIGHALSNGVGMLLGARFQKQDFRAFVLLGDGEMQEGQVWEAALCASSHGLSNLIAIVDRNGYQLDGKVDDVLAIEPLDEKWQAFGWTVIDVDGHAMGPLVDALEEARALSADGPVMVGARAVKGKGGPFMEGRCEVQGKAP